MRMESNSTFAEFHTERWVRVSQLASVCLGIVLNVLVATGFALVLGFVLSVLNMPIWLCVLIGVAFVFCYTAWSLAGVTSRLRFCLIFHPDCAQFGTGFLRLNIPYEEVELFGYARKAKDDCMSVVWHGHHIELYLPKASLISCFALLHERSVNAVFLDRKGHEHLPHSPTRPAFSLDVLHRSYRRRALMGLAVLGVCLFVAIIAVVELLLGLRQANPQGNFWDLIRLFCEAILACVVGLWTYFRYAKKAKRAFDGVMALEKKEREEEAGL